MSALLQVQVTVNDDDGCSPDDMRKIRVVSDIELCRVCPGWFCVMFHYGRYLAANGRWKMFYTVQMTKDSEPQLRQLLIGRIRMADGSLVWGRVEG